MAMWCTQNGDTVLLLSWSNGSENTKWQKMFSLIVRSNLNWFKLSIHDFEALPEPFKMIFVSWNASRIGGVMKQNMSKIWCATFFRLLWVKLNVSITIEASLKSFEDITDKSELESITFIHISLRRHIWAWQPCKQSLLLPGMQCNIWVKAIFVMWH